MKGLMAWFAGNSIAANLLMLSIIVGGTYGGYKIVEKEVFPSREANIIDIRMSYLGAGPKEVEEQIVTRIENAIADVNGIFQIRSSARQGAGIVTIEVVEGFDVKAVLNDIKTQVDAINTFPGNTERPIISQQKSRSQLMFFTLYGNADSAAMKRIAQQMADDMALLPGISRIAFWGVKSDEIAIEVSESTLQRYGVSFAELARAIRASSLNLPAGSIKSTLGNIQIQARNQAYTSEDFANIVIFSDRTGQQIKLGEIATIRDGFAEQDLDVRFNGEKAIDFTAFISDPPDLFNGTKNARAFIEKQRRLLPPGLAIDINYEMKQLFDSRLHLLSSNALGGLLLVFCILMLFLRPALAVWVCIGIATAFSGAIFLLPTVGISINMLSMFAFLMVLGIVVDDAIVVGESIYSEQQHQQGGVAGSIAGTKRVFKPVVLAVLSTIIFFLPMLDVPMSIEPYTESIFYVVLFCLIFSLVECLLILPAHLAHLKPEKEPTFYASKQLKKLRLYFSKGMHYVATHIYKPKLEHMLHHSGATITAFTMAFLLSLSVYIGGWIKTSFFPEVLRNFITADIKMPEGTAYDETLRVAKFIETQAESLRDDNYLRKLNANQPFMNQVKTTINGENIDLFIGLEQPEIRKVSSKEVSKLLRKRLGPLPEAQEYSLAIGFGDNEADIKLNLTISDNSIARQQQAVDAVLNVLSAYPGVDNARSSLEAERSEVEIHLKPHAHALGITLEGIAQQVRQGIFGEEVQRIPRGKEDVRVMLKYPITYRDSLDLLQDMHVRSDNGAQIPLHTVADITLVPGFTKIDRVDRKRNITITADTEEGTDGLVVIKSLLDDKLEQWQREFIGFQLATDGNLRAQAQFGDAMATNFIMSLIAVYALMAIAFRSYSEPLLILTAVPFGFMGAVIGHTLFGENISMMSFLGFLACAGVVVNDNLVLLDRINHLRDTGLDALSAVMQAGQDRFRAIILTSLTTFIGLLPILSERSSQAQFLQPMVIALAFGVLFASLVTLVLVPCLYLQGHKFKQYLYRKIQRLRGSIEETV